CRGISVHAGFKDEAVMTCQYFRTRLIKDHSNTMKLTFSAIALAALTLSVPVFAQDHATPSTNQPPAAIKPTKQADVASTNASFGKISKTDEAYKSALDAHALEEATKMVGKEGALKGTVTKVFEPRGVAILNFDQNFRSALTSVVYS